MILLTRGVSICVFAVLTMMIGGCGNHEGRRDEGRQYKDRDGDSSRFEGRKTAKLVFVNRTTKDKDVSIQLPGSPRRHIGVAAHGGELREQVVLDARQLPAEILWTAGRYDGAILLTRRAPEVAIIQIGRKEAPMIYEDDERPIVIRRDKDRWEEEED